MIDFQNMINGADLWIASSLMVMMSLIQAGLFLRTSWKEAGILGFSNKQKTACLRSAALTAAGPSLSPIIIMISMIAIVGGPTTWMVLNNVGAARTELAVVTMAANYAGAGIHLCPVGHCAERVWLAVCRMAPEPQNEPYCRKAESDLRPQMDFCHAGRSESWIICLSALRTAGGKGAAKLSCGCDCRGNYADLDKISA